MLNLDHPQIVPLIGFCRQPMSLVLELAPEGALDTKLEDYKRVGARLTPISMQKIIVQVRIIVGSLVVSPFGVPRYCDDYKDQ